MVASNEIDNVIQDRLDALSIEDWSKIMDMNAHIQNHKGSWGEIEGGKKTESGVIEMPYANPAPIISEFMKLWYEKDLVIAFDWSSWQEGRDWYANPDNDKYKKLDVVTALKLITAVLRNDRFNDGALMRAFESGDFPKIINRLIETHDTI